MMMMMMVMMMMMMMMMMMIMMIMIMIIKTAWLILMYIKFINHKNNCNEMAMKTLIILIL